MTNEMKLLRAFIEASGFDITETLDRIETLSECGQLLTVETGIDYKVTKKPNKDTGTFFDEVFKRQVTNHEKD